MYQYCIHQPETAIASLERVLDKEREALAIPQGIALIVAQEERCDRSHLAAKFLISIKPSGVSLKLCHNRGKCLTFMSYGLGIRTEVAGR